MSQTDNPDPSELSDRELLERIAELDSETYNLPERAADALEDWDEADQEDDSP